jgi:SAM-dependent methyltransferase
MSEKKRSNDKGVTMGLLDFLKLPDAELITDLDSPDTATIHQRIIQSKPFLKRLYVEFYQEFKKRFPQDRPVRCVVEIGSGAGFIKEVLPGVITSDLFPAPWVDQAFSAEKMPFEDGSVDAFLLLNVFHHLPQTAQCLKEMSRCLRPNGKIIMIEPANTAWQSFVARNFHHEPYDVKAGWGLEGEGRLSAGNGALPWIVFVRDRQILEKDFPELKVLKIDLHTPFRYILSGGMSYRALMPIWMFPVLKGIEGVLSPLNFCLGFFQTIEVEKIPQK